MNKFIFVGNLAKDFQINESGVARGSIALDAGIDKDGNRRPADFINLTAFGKTAETLAKYGKKGKRFLFEGRVKSGSYEKDGKRIYTEDHVIDRMEFCDRKESDQDSSAGWSQINAPIEGIEEELPFV